MTSWVLDTSRQYKPSGSLKLHKQKHSWPANPAVVPCLSLLILSIHSQPTDTCTNSNISSRNNPLAGHIKTSTELIRLLDTCCPVLLCCSTWLMRPQCPLKSCVSSSDSTCHQRSLPDFVSRWRRKKTKPGLLSLPPAQFLSDVFPATFQVHYRDLCWDYDKNTCFLPFWSDQGHFSPSFFCAISYQSCTQLNNLPLFKQLTSLAASQENSRSTLSKSTASAFVLFITLSKPSSANVESCTTLSGFCHDTFHAQSEACCMK